MIQLSENVIMLNMGDPMPAGTDDAIKILLVGSESIDTPTMNGEPATYDWQSKFSNFIAMMADNKKGLLMFKNKRYVIVNCKYIPQMMPDPMIPDNNELITKYNYILEMANICDAIFCNILKKTISPLPLFMFGLFVASKKLVIRCPEEYPYYNLIKLISERSQLPLLPARTSAKDVLFSMFAYIPKFQELNAGQLPE